MILFPKTELKTLCTNAFKTLAIGAVLFSCFPAQAVTEAEMDNARAIAAKFYIRYVNDGAGYLDNWLPGSMGELEKKLTNDKDRQSFRQFKNASVPTDFSSWDKDQLVAYWGGSFFTENASHLDPKGAQNSLCKRQISKAVSNLKIAPPSATPAPETAAAAPTESELAADSMAMAAEAMADDSLAIAEARMAEAQDSAYQAALEDEKKESSGTWVYVMVLGILVAVVIFLVIYASRTMKGQNRKTARKEEAEDSDYAQKETPVERTVAPAPVSPLADDTRMRERYAENLAAKAEEIRLLTRQLSEMENLAAGLKEENRKLRGELDRLRSREKTESTPPMAQPAHHARNHEGGEPKEVYLGRVNSRGIFVRADRHAVDGQSIYKLTTTDGVSGSFSLINNPVIEEQVLDDPGKWLAGGCFAKDIFDTEGREGVRTEIPGKAIFSDGAWRVERKAKIRYE